MSKRLDELDVCECESFSWGVPGRYMYFKFNFESGKATIAGFRGFGDRRWTLGVCH